MKLSQNFLLIKKLIMEDLRKILEESVLEKCETYQTDGQGKYGWKNRNTDCEFLKKSIIDKINLGDRASKYYFFSIKKKELKDGIKKIEVGIEHKDPENAYSYYHFNENHIVYYADPIIPKHDPVPVKNNFNMIGTGLSYLFFKSK